MKLHIGADTKSGLIHSATITEANVHDSQVLPDLIRDFPLETFKASKAA